MNARFIGKNAPIDNVELRPPDVPSDDPEQMIRAIDLELQTRVARKAKRRTNPFYGLVGIVLMIAAVLIALQILISHMRTLSGSLNESRNSELSRH